MSAGLAVTKDQLDTQAGAAARSVLTAFGSVRDVKAYLDTKTSSDLVAMGYAQADADLLKSAYTDLGKLADLFDGLQTQASVYDFKTFARQIWGLVVRS